MPVQKVPEKVLPKKSGPTKTLLKKGQPGKTEVPIELADTPVPAETDFNKLTILIHGDRKIGKTSILSQFPDPYFLMFEPGANFLKLRRSACNDWDTFLRTLDALERKPKGYAQNYVLDTGFKMYEHCFRWTIKDLGLDDIRDDAWGNGWSKVNENFLTANERILALGGGYFATAHTETVEYKKRNGETYTKNVTELSKQARKWFTSFVDVIAYFTYDHMGKRIMHIRGDSEIEAGCRPPNHFKYTDGSEIQKIQMGGNPQVAYQNFINGFNNKLVRPKEAQLIKKPLTK